MNNRTMYCECCGAMTDHIVRVQYGLTVYICTECLAETTERERAERKRGGHRNTAWKELEMNCQRCGKPLRSDNRSGYCKRCHYAIRACSKRKPQGIVRVDSVRTNAEGHIIAPLVHVGVNPMGIAIGEPILSWDGYGRRMNG